MTDTQRFMLLIAGVQLGISIILLLMWLSLSDRLNHLRRIMRAVQVELARASMYDEFHIDFVSPDSTVER